MSLPAAGDPSSMNIILMHLTPAAGAHMQPPKQQQMPAAAKNSRRLQLTADLNRLSVTTCCSCSTSATCRSGTGICQRGIRYQPARQTSGPSTASLSTGRVQRYIPHKHLLCCLESISCKAERPHSDAGEQHRLTSVRPAMSSIPNPSCVSNTVICRLHITR